MSGVGLGQFLHIFGFRLSFSLAANFVLWLKLSKPFALGERVPLSAHFSPARPRPIFFLVRTRVFYHDSSSLTILGAPSVFPLGVVFFSLTWLARQVGQAHLGNLRD